MGVVPRLRPVGCASLAGVSDGLRGVCIPDGVDVPLKFRLGIPDANVGILDDLLMPPFLVGAGLADDGVRGREIVLPNAEIPPLPVTFVMVVLPTDKRVGRELELGVPVRRRCGIRDWDTSSVLSSDNDDP